MTRRLIFAVVLSLVVLFASDIFLRSIYRKKVPQKIIQEQTKESTELIPEPSRMQKPAAPTRREKEIKIDSDFYEVMFSSDGKILHWRLKAYKERDGSFVDLVSRSKSAGDYSYEVFPLKDNKGVRLYNNSGGVETTKEFIFDQGKKYQSTIRFSIINNSSSEKDISIFKWGPGIGGAADPRETTITSLAKSGVVRLKLPKVKENIKYEGAQWAGIGQKHFAVALIPESTEKQQLIIMKESEGVSIKSMIEKLPAGARIEGELFVYAGPKESEILKSSGNNLFALLNYGAIGKVIFYLLKWFYYITKNYGIAIILLSILIKVVLFPLSRMSLKSMREMQKIQPQIAMLKQRFKHEPESLNKETMELYRRMKINPMGGCLPMIFQLPIFWALFVVLRDAIELRQAPFIFWIRDLSARDPFYILPILMGVTTFVQQKMSATDSQQSTMTYFMTIFLTFIFLNFPSGLVLYWFTANVLSIGEQKLISKMT